MGFSLKMLRCRARALPLHLTYRMSIRPTNDMTYLTGSGGGGGGGGDDDEHVVLPISRSTMDGVC